jgi:integrase
MPRKTLTAVQVATINKPGFHRDPMTVGLYLQVTRSKSSVSRSWAYRFNSPIDGKLRWLGLGPANVVGLAEARQLAKDYRHLVRIERRDPVEERRAAKLRAISDRASAMTFAQCVEAYIAQHGGSWKNDKHRKQWRSTLERACQAFGKVDVSKIDTAAIVSLLTPIWDATPETGSRLRGRIEKVLDWATAAELRQGPNPARWKGHLQHLLAQQSGGDHHKALPWRDLPAFMDQLRAKSSISARALEFTILTAARTSEVIGARWDEIDLKARIWTIPASRMKAKVEHKVALSDRAIEILKGLRSDKEFVFASGKDDKPLSNMAMLELLRGMAGNGYTVHGFRSAFRDWSGERTNTPRDVIEFALAHKCPTKSKQPTGARQRSRSGAS